MRTIDDVAAWALTLPGAIEATSYRNRAWKIGGTSFAWERPLSKADIKRFRPDTPPSGPIVAVATGDMDEKAAILAEGAAGVFDIEHFSGYPAILIALDEAEPARVRSAIVDGWLSAAPAEMAEQYVTEHPLD